MRLQACSHSGNRRHVCWCYVASPVRYSMLCCRQPASVYVFVPKCSSVPKETLLTQHVCYHDKIYVAHMQVICLPRWVQHVNYCDVAATGYCCYTMLRVEHVLLQSSVCQMLPEYATLCMVCPRHTLANLLTRVFNSCSLALTVQNQLSTSEQMEMLVSDEWAWVNKWRVNDVSAWVSGW